LIRIIWNQEHFLLKNKLWIHHGYNQIMCTAAFPHQWPLLTKPMVLASWQALPRRLKIESERSSGWNPASLWDLPVSFCNCGIHWKVWSGGSQDQTGF
jgi:hypothetical protein